MYIKFQMLSYVGIGLSTPISSSFQKSCISFFSLSFNLLKQN